MSTSPLRIVADENIPALEIFESLGPVIRLPGRTMSSVDVAEADVLLVRSVTKVNASLLSGSRVKFVGTATIGIDHLDTDYLNQQGIAWSNAPGCNANSVAEYVLSALCHFYRSGLDQLMGKKAGIVGFGNVGKLVATKLRMLGMQVEAYDPLLNRAMYSPLQSLERVFDADVLCIHAPLTEHGRFPSYHMIASRHWQHLRQGACLISAGRGGVVADDELAAMIIKRPDVRTAIDVWENEPSINWELAEQVTLATPHIAGYSYDGKVEGTHMIYQALLGHFDRRDRHRSPRHSQRQVIDLKGIPSHLQIHHAIQTVYNIASDSERFKALLKAPLHERASLFDALRKHYPVRRECSHYLLEGLSGDATLRSQAMALGFAL